MMSRRKNLLGKGGLFSLSGLILWFAASVPESGNVEGIVLYVIYKLVQTVDDDTAVGFPTINEQWVDSSDVRGAKKSGDRIVNFLSK